MNGDKITVKTDVDASQARRELRRLRRTISPLSFKWMFFRSGTTGIIAGALVDPMLKSVVVGLAAWLLSEAIVAECRS